MTERPILFSSPMVRAILDGRKTVTRRVVKGSALEWLQPNMFTPVYVANPENHLCPYGHLGDRLWVRETFALESDVDGGEPPFDDGRPIKRAPADDYDGIHPSWVQAHYRATDPAPDLCCESERCKACRENDMGPHWKPSIHMPRWASRITLEVTAVRVERLQDITDDGAKAEGCFFTDYGRKCGHSGHGWTDVGDCPSPEAHHPQRNGWMWDKTDSPDQCLGSARFAFVNLWESINGADSWADNPWVWVVEFRRIES